jgi:hypothetical protein
VCIVNCPKEISEIPMFIFTIAVSPLFTFLLVCDPSFTILSSVDSWLNNNYHKSVNMWRQIRSVKVEAVSAFPTFVPVA